MAKRRTRKKPIEVTTITHDEASRRNIPTAEYRSVMEKGDQSPIQVAYQRRNRDLDPQLVWRGKDEAGLVRPRGAGAAAVHPGEGAPQGADRRPAAAQQGGATSSGPSPARIRLERRFGGDARQQRNVILIDTSAWVEFLRDTGSDVSARVDAEMGGEIAISDAIHMEVLAGARDESHLEARAGVSPCQSLCRSVSAAPLLQGIGRGRPKAEAWARHALAVGGGPYWQEVLRRVLASVLRRDRRVT